MIEEPNDWLVVLFFLYFCMFIVQLGWLAMLLDMEATFGASFFCSLYIIIIVIRRMRQEYIHSIRSLAVYSSGLTTRDIGDIGLLISLSSITSLLLLSNVNSCHLVYHNAYDMIRRLQDLVFLDQEKCPSIV